MSEACSLLVLIIPEQEGTGLTVIPAPTLFPSRRSGLLPHIPLPVFLRFSRWMLLCEGEESIALRAQPQQPSHRGPVSGTAPH